MDVGTAHWRSVAGLATLLATLHAAADSLAFDSYWFDTGHGDSPVVLHGDLVEDGGNIHEIVVLRRGEDDERRLAVYALAEGAWRLAHEAAVGTEVTFADIVSLGGQDRLLLYRRGHLDWLDPRDWKPKPMLAVPSLYVLPAADVPHVDVGRDIDGDQRDDIAVPDFEGYWLWRQRADGSLGPRIWLPVPATAKTNFGVASYRPRSLYSFDYDGDGSTDIAVWEPAAGERDGAPRARKAPGQLVVHTGQGDAGFNPEPSEARLPVAFESDDITVSFGFGAEPRTMLYDVDDYNGDGVADIVGMTAMIEGLFDQSTRYDFHFGRRHGGSTTFAAEPDTAIVSQGLQAPLDRRDLDMDGKKDFSMGSIDIGIGMLVRALLTGTVRFDLNFYVMRGNSYPAEPNVTRPVKIRFSLASGDVLAGNWVQIGDATGDGLADLLVRHDETRIDVYAGSADDELFAAEPFAVAVDLPDHKVGPDNVSPVDLNDDGRDDLLISFPARAGEEEPNRLGIVLSRS